MTGGCPIARALTSEKQGIESLLYHHVQYTIYFCIRWIVNIVMPVENIITVRQRELQLSSLLCDTCDVNQQKKELSYIIYFKNKTYKFSFLMGI